MANQEFEVLNKIFAEQINVHSIAVPLAPLPLEKAREVCDQNNYDIQLVLNPPGRDLFVYEHSSGSIRPLMDAEVVSDSTPILEILEALSSRRQLFVKVRRNITHLVSRADLDTIPVRIWLYGIVSLFEIKLRQQIETLQVDWQNDLSAKRLESTKELFRIKNERNEGICLLNCLQLTDLGRIVARNWASFHNFFPAGLSRKKLETDYAHINELRDFLAHGQDLNRDWGELFRLTQTITFFLAKMGTSM